MSQGDLIDLFEAGAMTFIITPHLARPRKSCPAGDLLAGLVVGL